MNLYLAYKYNHESFNILLRKVNIEFLKSTINELFKDTIHDDRVSYKILQDAIIEYNNQHNISKESIKEKFSKYSYYKALGIAKYIQSLHLHNINSYLDIGTGDGINPTIIAKKVHINLDNTFCTDVENNEFDFNFKGECNFTKYDGKNLPYDENSFDFITCFMVLHHVVDLNELIKSIRHVLRNNGYLLIRDHNANKNIVPLLNVEHDFYSFLIDLNPITNYGTEYRNFMSFDKLKNILTTNGFKLLRHDNKFFKDNISNNYYALYRLNK